MQNTAGALSSILTEAGTNEVEIMSFILRWNDPAFPNGRVTTFGINAAKVRELVAVPTEISRLPSQPAAVDGIFILRDRIIPLVNLCRWFGYEEYAGDSDRKGWVVMVIEIYAKQFGFIVHGVDKVYRISWSNIEPPPAYLSFESQCIVANARIGDQIIQMVDFEKVVASVDPSISMEAINAATESEPPAVQSHETGAEIDIPPGTVLLADDSRMIRDQVSKVLRRGGYNVLLAADGQNAWELLDVFKRNAGETGVEGQLQAIISDIEMPRMDGHHLCRKIKTDPAFARVPVLLFSSLINDSLRNKGLAVGADDQITKPDLPGLVDRLKAAVIRLTTGAKT